MKEESIINWQTWLVQGDQYLRASIPKNSKSKFGTEILYNLLSMSLESYIMALLDIHNSLPDNHTYTDLIEALDTVIQIDPDLRSKILQYENIQSICSVDKYYTRKPSNEEITDLREAIVELKQIAHSECKAA